MMKVFAKYLKNRKTGINFLLSKPRNDYSPATFHKLRVEIKKVKALFDLINFCSEDFKSRETFKPFKLIFRQAGKIRELQLEEAMLKKYFAYNSLSDYLKHLKEIRLKEQEIFFLMLNKKFKSRLDKKFKIISSHHSLITNKKANNYIKAKKQQFNSLLSGRKLEPEHVHEFRKLLKKLNYIRSGFSLKKQEKWILKKDVLPVLLGKWHDCQIIIRHINKTLERGGVNQKESAKLERVKIRISLNKEVYFKAINRDLSTRNFFSDVYYQVNSKRKTRLTENSVCP